MIRECFPTSVLLGSLESPVVASSDCQPQSVESQTISACLCTADLCNDIPGSQDSQAGTALARIDPTRRPRERERQRERERERVNCYQCGSLFSDGGNSDCTEFDEADPGQQGLCDPGEVCLLYTWQKSR